MIPGPERLLGHIRRLVTRPVSDPAADSVLLGRYIARRDEAAFAALVARYGPMVLGVCRRVLTDAHAAEDALQATFMVLARKAAAIRRPDALAGWLYGVARRVALKAQAASARRRLHEAQSLHPAPSDPRPDTLAELSARELLAILDEEVQRLPEVYRLPVILCCLEHRTQEEAARQLGWTPGSVKGRLERGKARLHERLARRGLALSAALAAVEVSRGVASAATAGTMVRAAMAFAAEKTAGVAGASAQAAALAEEVVRGMLMTKVKILAALVLAAGVAVAGAGLVARQAPPAKPPAAGPKEKPAPAAKQADRAEPDRAEQARTDRYGDPLPPGALARLGTIRLQPGGRIWQLAFSPDGKRLASWAEQTPGGASLSIWDTRTGRELRHVAVPDADLWAFAWLADGRGVAVLRLGDDSFYVWDFADGNARRPPLIRRPRLRAEAVSQDQERYACFAVAPNGKLLAAGTSGSQDRERPVHVWDLATGKALKDLGTPRLLGRQPGNCAAAVFTPDSRSLLVLSSRDRAKDGKLVAWDVARGKPRREMALGSPVQQGYARALAVAPDGRTVALRMPDGSVRLWDLAVARERSSLATNSKGPGVLALAFSADGKRLITGCRDNTVRAWEAADGRALRTMRGHHGWVDAVAASGDGSRVASAGEDGLIRIWARPPGPTPARWKAIATGSGGWLSRPTAARRPQSAATAPCGSGTWPDGSNGLLTSAVGLPGCPRSRPTAGRWPPARMAACGCGPRGRGKQCGCRGGSPISPAGPSALPRGGRCW